MRKLTTDEKKNLFELMRTHDNYKVRKAAHFLLLKSMNFKDELLSRIFEISNETLENPLDEFNFEDMQSSKNDFTVKFKIKRIMKNVFCL